MAARVAAWWSSLTCRTQGWLACLAITLFAAVLRLVRLGSPGTLIFDETYYVKDAWTMLMTGEARDWPKTVGPDQVPVNSIFAQGDTSHWLPSAEYVVHPPLGKWCIALGLKFFGGAGNPFAWRIATALAGSLAVLLLCRVALRLFRNLPIALMAGLLMSIDGLGLVMSRTGLLDNFIMVFALAAFLCLLGHRDWARGRLREAASSDARQPGHRYRLVAHHPGGPGRGSEVLSSSSGPFIAWSWWRTGAALLLGMATGTKWSGAYLFAVFAVISVLWDAWERHQAGYSHWLGAGIVKDGLPAALLMVPLWAATYLASWTGWFIHPDSYMHQWASTHPGQGVVWLPDGLRSFVEYHRQMWRFHTTLHSPHPYMANPLTWPLQVRPTSFYWEKLPGHPGLCSLAPASQCVASVTSLGNPLIWWLGTVCLVLSVLVALMNHGDWKVWAVLAGFLGGWLPWTFYLNRTTFTFYAVVILPWMVLAICYMADWLRRNTSRTSYRCWCTATLGLISLVSLFFLPIWTALPVPYEFWRIHMWLPSWI
ncbi:dolichyl-phosphate-mannose--protein mannosyltransferase [Bifidobacterium favimelis]|uniref:Polyprenol-phosphate-mannose--protein mannosyltransferase n=1 Tax=Bifidobacterium favimelis TaxID=3122979 RepID=A0ABU8ZQC9_9BIFI